MGGTSMVETSKKAKSGKPKLLGKSVFLSGCKDEETAKELTWRDPETKKISKRGGALTFALLKCLGPNFENDTIPIGELLKFVVKETASRGQKPCLSASFDLDLTTPLRELCAGK